MTIRPLVPRLVEVYYSQLDLTTFTLEHKFSNVASTNRWFVFAAFDHANIEAHISLLGKVVAVDVKSIAEFREMIVERGNSVIAQYTLH